MRVAISIRVSTGKQELDNQLDQLTAWADREGHKVVKVYSDIVSGSADYKSRKGFYQLLQDIKEPKKSFDCVVFWALDRLTREGAMKSLMYLELFKNYGVKYHSYSEPFLSTLGPFADVIVSLLGTVAKMERERIAERTKAGLATAKKNGVKLGRPSIAQRHKTEILQLKGEGGKIIDIAKRFKISERSVRRIL